MPNYNSYYICPSVVLLLFAFGSSCSVVQVLFCLTDCPRWGLLGCLDIAI